MIKNSLWNKYRLILRNIIFRMLKSFIFFAKQTLTLSLKRVSFLNSESNSSVIYDVTKVKKKISIDIPFMESKEGEKRLIEEN